MNTDLVLLATKNVAAILNICIQHTPPEKAVVIFDTQYGLTDIVTAAYRANLPNAEFINFDETAKEDIIAKFDELFPGDLVVLIQSSSFLLNEFRIRLHLFQKGLKVIEHMHLHRNTPDTWETYVNALSYDPDWYRTVGPALKAKLDKAKELIISSSLSTTLEATTLRVAGGVESTKLNIGDYTGMDNIGGTFPIGEVFTEARDLSQMNGSLMIYAYAGSDFSIEFHEPFRIDITDGLVTSWADNAPQSFIDIMTMVTSYERPLIREIGFGLNRAITRERYLQDITAFERTLGLHFSLGEKHSVYKKPGITTHKTKFHVDLFPVVDHVTADTEVIFSNGAYHI